MNMINFKPEARFRASNDKHWIRLARRIITEDYDSLIKERDFRRKKRQIKLDIYKVLETDQSDTGKQKPRKSSISLQRLFKEGGSLEASTVKEGGDREPARKNDKGKDLKLTSPHRDSDLKETKRSSIRIT